MTAMEETLRQLSRETGGILAELGVRPEDGKWIAEHAATIASLAGGKPSRRRRSLGSLFYRLARRAARTAR